MKLLTPQSEAYLDTINKFKQSKKGIAHFNISNLEQARAICEVASELNQPVIIGVSENERKHIGTEMVRKLVDELNQEYDTQIFLNADHTYTFEDVVKVTEAGYDSVIVDATKLPYEENVAFVRKCVDFIRNYETKTGKRVLVEAELGYIGQSSTLNEEIPDGVKEENLTTKEQAKDFILRTGIDMFAPAVGNIHGMMINGPEPALRIDKIKDISESVDAPLVLHGASGNTDEDLKNAVNAGVTIIHINTEIRKAFRDAERDYMNEHPNDVALYKIGTVAEDEMKKVVRAKMEIYIN